jgi:hypothetical protein
VQRQGGLTLVQLEQDAAFDTVLDDSQPIGARTHADGIAVGIAIATKHLVGADLPTTAPLDAPGIPEPRTVSTSRHAVPRLRLLVTGMFAALVLAAGLDASHDGLPDFLNSRAPSAPAVADGQPPAVHRRRSRRPAPSPARLGAARVLQAA